MGASYIKKKKRSVGPVCRGNCEKWKGTKCSQLKQSDREHIFDEFWQKYSKKKDRDKFLSSLIDNSPTDNDIPIYLYHLQLRNERIRVCRAMFLNTLGISIKMLKFSKEKSKSIKENSKEKSKSITETALSDVPMNDETESDTCDLQSDMQSQVSSNKCFEFFDNADEQNEKSQLIGTIDTIITREIGVQCELLQELWTDFSSQSKTKLTLFDNFLDLISLSDNLKQTNMNMLQRSYFFKLVPEDHQLDNIHSVSDSYIDGQSTSANESVVDSLGYQDDVDTIATGQDSDASDSEDENYFQPKSKLRKLSDNYVHVLNGFKCLKCYKIFHSKMSIIKHLQTHLLLTKHWKEEDDRNFLKKPMTVHKYSNYRKFCHSQKRKRSNLRRAVNEISDSSTETQEKDDDCSITSKTSPICFKKFTTEQSALDHINIHTSNTEKPYECLCGAKFSEYKNLIWHSSKCMKPPKNNLSSVLKRSQNRVQSKQLTAVSESFYCKICDIDFCESKSEKHFLSEHHLQNENVWIRKYNIRKFTCIDCKKEFEMLLELIRHQVKQHEQRISFMFFERLENFNLKYCYVCDKSFVKRINYYDHMNMHKKIYAYACSCGKKFQFYNSLLHHSQKRGCAVEGRILPSYCPNSNSGTNEVKKTKLDNSDIEDYSDADDKALDEIEDAGGKKTKRIIDITGNISKISEEDFKQNEILQNNTKQNRDGNLITHQTPIIYLPQIYNNECILDQNQIFNMHANQKNHLISSQMMPGTVYVYETLPQPNVVQIPQIVNISDIGQTIQIPLSQNSLPKAVDTNPQLNDSNTQMESNPNTHKNYAATVTSEQIIPSAQVTVTSNLSKDANKDNHLDSVSESEIEPDEDDVGSNDEADIFQTTETSSCLFYCELCRQSYGSASALKHLSDSNHRKLEDEWRKVHDIRKIICPLCPRVTFDKFYGLICHQYKIHGIKIDNHFFMQYQENFSKFAKI